jgi:ABC-type uncharacterized transport system involved in gliding motility auxiliary subunit
MNTAVTILFTFCIAVVIVAISYSHNKRFDLTQEKMYTLSAQSVNLTKNLSNDVNVYIFYGQHKFLDESKNMLDQYKSHSKKIKIIAKETLKSPIEAKEFGVRNPDTIVMQSGNRKETVNTPTEENLTNALIKITQSGKKTVYFSTGHGERNSTENKPESFGTLADSLKKETYEVKTINTMQQEKFPEDCDVLIIAGPKSDFSDVELTRINEYITKGGAVIFLMDSQGVNDNLNKFLAEKDLKVDNDIIVDQLGLKLFRNPFFSILAEYSSHKIVADFTRMTAIFPNCKSLELSNNPGAKIKWDGFAKTTQYSWTKNPKNIKTDKDLQFDPKTDRKGPLVVAAAASIPINKPTEEKPEQSPDPKKRKESRLVVFGDVEFSSNALLQQNVAANTNLMMNAISWAAEQENLISIRPKNSANSPVVLKEPEKKVLFWISVVFLPLVVVIIGISVFLNRNN